MAKDTEIGLAPYFYARDAGGSFGVVEALGAASEHMRLTATRFAYIALSERYFEHRGDNIRRQF